jgi:hypothetical protein
MVTGPLLALCALLAVSPVDQAAASATTKVVSRVGLPTSFSLADVDSAPDTCTATPGTATATHVVGPGSPPLGLGSLALSFTAGAEFTDDVHGVVPRQPDPSSCLDSCGPAERWWVRADL